MSFAVMDTAASQQDVIGAWQESYGRVAQLPALGLVNLCQTTWMTVPKISPQSANQNYVQDLLPTFFPPVRGELLEWNNRLPINPAPLLTNGNVLFDVCRCCAYCSNQFLLGDRDSSAA